ncbi:MAG: VWA domain-containing protein, partial [Candidatus Angelobacter sp.]
MDEVHTIPRVSAESSRPPATKPGDSTLHRAKALRSDVDVVLVPITVTDPMNRPVLGLQKKDFKIYENNTPQ